MRVKSSAGQAYTSLPEKSSLRWIKVSAAPQGYEGFMGRRLSTITTDRRAFAVERRVNADDAKARLAERDRRDAEDGRDDLERLLGDPPKNRSALTQKR
jgi:hypothetical protein